VQLPCQTVSPAEPALQHLAARGCHPLWGQSLRCEWAGSGSIGRYSVASDGTLTALGSTVVDDNPASHPLDEGVSGNLHYLYVLADGLHQLVGYSVGQGGSLTPVTSVSVSTGSGGIGVS
jgi:hypothetical protein